MFTRKFDQVVLHLPFDVFYKSQNAAREYLLHVFYKSQIPAVFLLCTVVAAAMHLSEASPVDDQYVTCFNDCKDKCKSEGNGYSFCEMKCDTDCLARQALGRLHEYISYAKKKKKN